MRHESILEAVGRTPLIRLKRIAQDLPAPVYAKCEYLNPGGSVKDRIAITMIEEAEKTGKLKPGATIIEGTSGNTGFGLALVCVVKGYKMIFTITDKQSREKVSMLKALGAEVIVCPTAVAPEDPRSYYSVAQKLSEEIPGAFYPNQYQNQANPLAHYLSTGPEIWEDTEGKITHFVAGMGTGGTISGVGKYLKEKNPKIKVIGADPIGSLYYEYFKTGKLGTAEPYVVEGVGEDIIPGAINFKYIDEVLQVTDKDSFVAARQLARQEGLFAGGSSGTALWAALQAGKNMGKNDVMVVLLPDSGNRYLNKIYNEDWMIENRYLPSPAKLTAGDILRQKKFQKLVAALPSDEITAAWKKMNDLEISVLPVMEDGRNAGSISEDMITSKAMLGENLKGRVVRELMGAPFPEVAESTPAEDIFRTLTASVPAILVRGSEPGILTKFDVVQALYHTLGKR